MDEIEIPGTASVDPIFYSTNEVLVMVGVSRSMLYKLSNDGKFPAPVKIGWLTKFVRTEVDEWVAQQIAGGVRGIETTTSPAARRAAARGEEYVSPSARSAAARAESRAATVEPPVKRGRGRPRKYPVVVEVA